MLTAHGLRKRYKARDVVRDFTMQLAEGEVVGLLGPNGAGKTTCFYMIVGLIPSDGGKILLDGEDISALPMHARAVRGIGYLPQEPSVFRRMTVADNVMAILELRRDLDKQARVDHMTFVDAIRYRGAEVVFLRAEGQASGYMPLQDGARTVLAARVRMGSIIGGDELSIPSDRLFYSGGGGSVRGYEYQGVGPRLDDNTPRGGLSLFETSLEVRRDIGERWGAAAFVEGGAIGFQETPNFSNMRWAAGVGVRYKLPFGPIRADVAFPLDTRPGDPDFQVYVSIGQAF